LSTRSDLLLMRYPTVSLTKCREFARGRAGGAQPAIVPDWIGREPEIDRRPLRDAEAEVEQVMKKWEHLPLSRRADAEGDAAVIVYDALTEIGVHPDNHAAGPVLDDPGFWRYLTLCHFWKFVEWRHWEHPDDFHSDKHMRYVDAVNSQECVVSRMYLRMAAVGGLEDRDLASCLTGAGDFWRSHILRVRTASAPPLTRAMVRAQRDSRLKAAHLRELAKRVNRTWSNVVLDLYDDVDADGLIADLREGVDD